LGGLEFFRDKHTHGEEAESEIKGGMDSTIAARLGELVNGHRAWTSEQHEKNWRWQGAIGDVVAEMVERQKEDGAREETLRTSEIGEVVSEVVSLHKVRMDRDCIAELEGQMEELVKERDDFREVVEEGEGAIETAERRMRIFAMKHEDEQRLRRDMADARQARMEFVRRLRETEEAMEGLEQAVQGIVQEREARWKREIKEMEEGIAERRRKVEESRWRAMRGGDG
jgi:chromosome segregation ATPase